jgi:hypothetical protein
MMAVLGIAARRISNCLLAAQAAVTPLGACQESSAQEIAAEEIVVQ